MPSSLTVWVLVGMCAVVSLIAAPRDALIGAAVSLALGSIGVAIALWRARTMGGDAARPWIFFALGGVSSIAYDTTATVFPRSPDVLGVSLTHVLSVAIAAFFLSGVISLLTRRRQGYAEDVLLAASVAAAVPVVLLWELAGAAAVENGVAGTTVGVELLRLWVNATMVLTVVALLRGRRRSVTVMLIGVAAVSFTTASILTALHLPGVLDQLPGALIPPSAEVVSLIGGAAAVAAALHPSATALAERVSAELPLVKRRNVVLLFAVLMAIPAGALLGPKTPSDSTAYAIFGVAISVVVAVRATALLTDRNALLRRFEAMTVSLREQATTDALTGLPNRPAITAHLEEVLAERRADLRSCAAIFVDLDDFKIINDSLGHDAGDELLRLVAERLRSTLHADERVGRFGGDEFVVVIPVVKGVEDARRRAVTVLESLHLVTVVRGHEVQVKPSLGLCVSRGMDETPESMLRDADAAMYAAKRGSSPVVFDAGLYDSALDRLDLQQRLRRALDGDEIHAAFQPKVRLDRGTIGGVEVLARWRLSSGTMVSPDRFIPIAEQSGLIHRLGRRMIELACREMLTWRAAGVEVPVSINVSAAELVRPDYPATMRLILARFDVNPTMITLELTERDLGDVAAVTTAFDRLRADGIRISIDDFGTGFFSLTHLRRLPVDEVKIDRGFVDGVDRDDRDRAIVRAVIELATGLDLEVVAEGVETREQAVVLRDLRCPEAQGYLWGAPMDADEVGRKLIEFLAPHAAARPASEV
ncbi:putative bifunctional diguanylate cyclase/phosphodiesterase [Euzebya tangerina]|uniref:putative bifunctional diguanylate cyclase/phosphodiesterase n=1 Tax=Euzebya tangerina TaxID=591198 RepID=UPI000E320CB2|nr:bifunctional diguanylate cyclase/phosphodiesterase [Euzebya tangerina]